MFTFVTIEIGHSLAQALHFNTYGGNPMSCAVGSAVLDVSCLGNFISFSVESILFNQFCGGEGGGG